MQVLVRLPQWKLSRLKLQENLRILNQTIEDGHQKDNSKAIDVLIPKMVLGKYNLVSESVSLPVIRKIQSSFLIIYLARDIFKYYC